MLVRFVPIASLLFAVQASAQYCDETWREFHLPGPGPSVHALQEFDDGTGPALFVGGFSLGFPAASANVAMMRLRNGILDEVGTGSCRAFTSSNVGLGPTLFAGGSFGIATWNGTSFAPVGGPPSSSSFVNALASFDDGSGTALYAGGDFTHLGGIPFSRIARWNGTSWSDVGGGTNGTVNALCVFDDGSGSMLYAAGNFSQAGLAIVPRVASWTGSTWQPVGGGPPGAGIVNALVVYDAGGGPRLHAGTSAGVWRLDGALWTSIGASASPVLALHVADTGSGPRLRAAGSFSTLGGANSAGIAEWDGAAWSSLGSGLSIFGTPIGRAVTTHDAGSGRRLWVGGSFESAGDAGARGLASWDGTTWNGIEPATTVSGPVTMLSRDSLGGARSVLIGGLFNTAGPIAARNVARWNGTSWSALGTGLGGSPNACVAFDDGSGPALYFGGSFLEAGGVPASCIARWNGTTWSAVGLGLNNTVRALVVHDDGSGPELFAGGHFTASGSTPAARVARWNGTAWRAVGSGADGVVNALASFDDGSGSLLVAAGAFQNMGGFATSSVARWNGAHWSTMGAGLTHGIGGFPPTAFALCIHDAGGGTRLYAGGQFTRSGATVTNGIAEWNGTAWQTTATGAPNEVYGLATWRTSSGPALVATHYHLNQGSTPLALLRNGNWSHIGGNLQTTYSNQLLAFDSGDSGGEMLLVGAVSLAVAGIDSNYLAALAGCALEGAPYCAGDGQDPSVTIACPCGNSGGPRRGCGNSIQSLGAHLSAYGSTAMDDVRLTSAGMPLNAPCVFLKGDADVAGGIVFGDGVRCVGGNLIRIGTLLSSAGTASYPGPGSSSLSVRGGTPPGSGLFADYQVYYRNAAAAFCPPSLFNVSNGWRLVW